MVGISGTGAAHRVSMPRSWARYFFAVHGEYFLLERHRVDTFLDTCLSVVR